MSGSAIISKGEVLVEEFKKPEVRRRRLFAIPHGARRIAPGKGFELPFARLLILVDSFIILPPGVFICASPV